MIDASIAQAPKQSLNKEEKAIVVEDNAMPLDWSPPNTSRDIYANKGYINFKREERLTSEGYRMHIQRKGSKDKPLSEAQ